MRLTREEFDNTFFMRECVVEIVSLRSNEVAFNGGTLLITGGGQQEDSSQAVRFGKLVKLPKKTGLFHGNMFSCKLDAEVGDYVYWDGYWSAQELLRKKGDAGMEDTLIEVEDSLYLRIPSTSLVAAVRGDKYIALNGFIIAKPMPEEDKELPSGLWVPAEKKSVTRAKVVAAPKSLPEFRDKDHFKPTRVREGDVIISEDFYQIPLDKTYSSKTDLVRVLCAVVIGVEND